MHKLWLFCYPSGALHTPLALRSYTVLRIADLRNKFTIFLFHLLFAMKKDHISSLPEDRDLLYRFVSSRYVAPPLGCQRFWGCSSNYSKGPVFWTSLQSLPFLIACFVFRGFTEHPSTHVHRHAHTFLSLTQQGAHPFSPPTPQPLIAPLARSPPSDFGTRTSNLNTPDHLLSTEASTDT